MDWNSILSYFNGSGGGSTPPINQAPAQQSITQLMQAAGQQPSGMLQAPSQQLQFLSGSNKKPIADKPDPDEVSLDVYPTIHSLQPTKLNGGKPWAGQKIPTGYLDGLAYAEAKARSIGGFEEDTLKQFLPLATRESRYKDYGNNGVLVDYKTPPPKNLQGIIDQSNTYAKLEKDAWAKGNMKLWNESRQKREVLDAKLLADPSWTSRADSYHDVTNKAIQLGLEQSTNQELIRDEKTGKLISKADRYRADDKAPYAIKALHVPLALYNKQVGEGNDVSGLALTKKYVGGGDAAVIRNKQEAQIGKAIYHPKNKPVLDYYTQRVQHHTPSVTKGKK